MVTAVEVLLARLPREEGDIAYPYNDATGKRVSCRPGGNLTIAEGINLEDGLDAEERAFLVQHRVNKAHTALLQYSWYAGITDPYRQSVPLDIAFNGGVHDLLGYPHMIAAIAKGDWEEASRQCTDKDPKLDASRYAPLRQILLYGNPT